MQGAESSGELILVVDDDHHNLFVVQRRLESYEFQVITASSGDTALELAEANKPDLILLDVTMPGMDGFEVKRRLTRTDATRDIPVIFLSSRIQIEFKKEAFDLGADDFLAKPYHPEELLARMRVVLRNRRKVNELVRQVKDYEQQLRGGGVELANEEMALDKLDRAIQIADGRREPMSCINLKVNGVKDMPNGAVKNYVLMETGKVLQEMINTQTDAVLAYREEGEYLLFAVGMKTQRAQILGEGVKSSIMVRAFTDQQSEQLSVSIGISGKEAGSSLPKEAILAGAAAALEQAVAAGGSRIVLKRLEE